MKQLLSIALSLFWIGNVMAIEEPKYTVVMSDGPGEVRLYAPVLVAETLVEGDMDQASGKGFRLIADFIFGNNQVGSSAVSDKIAMTAPVTIEPQSAKIAMTAPVMLEPQSSVVDFQTTQQWLVKFVMPSHYNLDTIPKPKNNAVKLRELPGKRYVVLTYSGFNTQSRVQAKSQEAMDWARKHQLNVLGAPQLSRYDPPWTLPMFRRNEIMIEVAAP